MTTYDEAYDASGCEAFSGYDGLYGDPVYTVAVSPYTAGMGPSAYNTSHSDLLSTIEWLLDLPGTSTGNDATVEFPVMAQLFHASLFGPNVDLQYADLRGVDLAGSNLRGDDLQYEDLQGANLSSADHVNVVCGKPNDITAKGAILDTEGVPPACIPPL